jgi:Domain of unknown function (DUF4145)
MKTSHAPCSICLTNTEQNVLHSVDGRRDDFCDPHYDLLQCAGCKEISLRLTLKHIHDTKSVHYFPSPASRKVPDWLYEGNVARPLGGLLHEIYQAVRGGQLRLAIMGIRALIEQVMIHKVGDNGTFAKNLNAFQQTGYISLVQRDALNDILDAGHAAIHRAYEPKTKDIQIALDITEGIMAAIFVHAEAAKKVSERVPARRKTPNRP